MRLLFRSLAAVLAAALLLAVAPSVASAAGEYAEREDAFLAISGSGDRSEAVALDGATVEAGGQAAVFLAPLDIEARQVRFYLNGHRVKTERAAPYDLRGTKSDGTAATVSVDRFEPGENSIEARVYTSRSDFYTVKATFTVGDAPAPLPTIAEIAVGDAQFSTLVTALTVATEAGAVDFLGAVSDPEADL
ncbi:MAG: hypothetical protein AAF962_21815, partial [Actinomycetota bacterium]